MLFDMIQVLENDLAYLNYENDPPPRYNPGGLDELKKSEKLI